MKKGHKTLSCSYATEEGLWPGMEGAGGGDGIGESEGEGWGVAAVPKGRNAVMIKEEELTKLISTPRRSVCGFVAFVRASAARVLWPYGVWFVSLLHKRFKTFFSFSFFVSFFEGGWVSLSVGCCQSKFSSFVPRIVGGVCDFKRGSSAFCL